MAIDQRQAHHRGFFRVDVSIPATLFLLASDDMRRTCQITNLSGSGCAVRLNSLEPIQQDATHQIRFELPNRPQSLYFDCQVVRAVEIESEGGQDLYIHFTDPPRAAQDAVVSYLHNKKRFDSAAWKVAIPVAIAAQTGLRAFKPFKGATLEVGKDYAVSDLRTFELANSTEVVATFTAPGYRDDVFFPATVTKVDRTNMGYRVKVEFENAGEKMLDFIRRYYHGKAKALPPVR